MYWEPAKYVAKLRTLKTDNHPLLLVTNMQAGHGGARPLRLPEGDRTGLRVCAERAGGRMTHRDPPCIQPDSRSGKQ